ncbi:MAG TPA: DUF1847 domain-containing protein [Myxococcota bacterium]|nr:DUF1847 domain-containing protein [Myxococcota bacterium]HNZ03692.1 DUF1847 domain-containing protein [Myxococcota bacterium]HOD07883.1 DUF1847 domain-containing protein [Myxococcota bacterium]HQP95992.1 DUF1847 domain-containing protein [Myxococcota bacterium]
MKSELSQCVRCTIRRCSSKDAGVDLPSFCPTRKYPDLVMAAPPKYRVDDAPAILNAWFGLMSQVLDPARPREKYSWSRVDEIMKYARLRGMKRIGIATCYSMSEESRILSGILEQNGFEVASVCCLCGETDPAEFGLPGNVFCNPILQASVLDREQTELNIMMGLCVGHDILFLKHSTAETTPLVVRDCSTGNNPVAVLYQSRGGFNDRFFKPLSAVE